MRLISLVLKPKIAKDSFKPKWLQKLYLKLVCRPACILQGIYAVFKYEGDILQDWDMGYLLYVLWDNEETKQKARDYFMTAERIKWQYQEARKNK